METLRYGVSAEQKGRHQGGSPKWIGTGRISPFGPQPMAIIPRGCGSVKDKSTPWQRGEGLGRKREFKDFAGDESGAAQHLRPSAPAAASGASRARGGGRTGPRRHDHSTADKGAIDVGFRPEQRNAVKVLLFLDVGGSMAWHVETAKALFSARAAAIQAARAFLFPQLSLRERLARAIAADSTSARRPPAC